MNTLGHKGGTRLLSFLALDDALVPCEAYIMLRKL